jgi:cell surface protein SprA
MSRGWDAPGFDFISGFQPKINRRADEDTGDWLAKARSEEWITTNAFQNNPILQTSGKSIDSRLTLEPFNDFKIDVDFSRNLTQNFSEFFKTYHKTDESIDSIFRRSPRSVGSFTISWFSIPTLFKDDSLQINSLFKEFESNRSVVSELRGVGEHEVDGPDYHEDLKKATRHFGAGIPALILEKIREFQFTDILIGSRVPTGS